MDLLPDTFHHSPRVDVGGGGDQLRHRGRGSATEIRSVAGSPGDGRAGGDTVLGSVFGHGVAHPARGSRMTLCQPS